MHLSLNDEDQIVDDTGQVLSPSLVLQEIAHLEESRNLCRNAMLAAKKVTTGVDACIKSGVTDSLFTDSFAAQLAEAAALIAIAQKEYSDSVQGSLYRCSRCRTLILVRSNENQPRSQCSACLAQGTLEAVEDKSIWLQEGGITEG